MKIENLFPTALFQHKVSPSIADYVEEIFLQNYNKLQQTPTLKTDFFNDKKSISLNEISPLMEEIDKCLEYYCSQIQIFIPKIFNYWIQDYSENEFHELHNHGRCELSLVYWIRSNKKAGSIYTSNFILIPPTKGGLIIFPSFLDHEALPSEKGCIRTTLAINYQ